MQSIDVSNFTPRFTLQNIANWRAQGIDLGIVQLIGGVHYTGDDPATQIDLMLQGGMVVDCYLFPGNDGLPLTTSQRLALVPPSARVKIRQLWVDIEPASSNASQASINLSMAACDSWAPWQKAGQYTAYWVAQKYGWLPWPWPNRKQWLVNATGVANTGGTFAGTNNHVMTQFALDATVDGISGVDVSQLTPSEELAVIQWRGGPMAIVVGDGMAAQMAAAGDTPLCDHVNYDQTDDDGNVYQVEKCVGSSGKMYISSNSSGQWVNTGPN